MMSATQASSVGGIDPRLQVEGHVSRVVADSVAGASGILHLARGIASVATADSEGSVRATVLAEPLLVLFPGTEVMVRSGGEFRTEGTSGDWGPVMHGQRLPHQDIPASGWGPGWTAGRGWKDYGLSLRATWTDCYRDLAAVQYEVWLTQRISGSDDHLLAGRISGKKLVSMGEMAFGGAVDFTLDADSRSGSWWISHVPLVGDWLGGWLSRRGEERGKSQMSVWLGLDSSDQASGVSHSKLEINPEGASSALKSVE